jgi:hypothetical protein
VHYKEGKIGLHPLEAVKIDWEVFFPENIAG